MLKKLLCKILGHDWRGLESKWCKRCGESAH
jgi:hypothetical protein